ncbi:hypothetical protein IFM89_004048 [Coptis chinensis]|uniref:Uncharacterized protein n=1 Tax=Coptis chinensis TaxID=261450 RepID=A0A835LAV1_9MAGN|nr:hypothetical protein IFM89_004048 [Coptis chinensis]
MYALTQLSEPITHWFKTHHDPPVAILSDFFLGWTQELATQLGIPRIAFYCSGAFLVSVLDYLWINISEIHPLDVVTFYDIPNSPDFPKAHLPSVILRYSKSDPAFEFAKKGMVANMSSWGGVFNTFDELESVYLEHLKKQYGHERVWSVGPVALLDSGGAEGTERGGTNSISAVDVVSWLDKCSDGSVVYVCFGSQVTLSSGQVEALTKGLEESGTRFIFVVKSTAVVPHGFEDRVADRGLVIKGWAPQVPILSHRAVGGFLTHCGWNSVLEGIVAGVMLFAWPMEADQFVNAKLLVDDMGVAVRVCEGVDTVPNSDELARFLAESMSGIGTEKVRAMELREKALGAAKKGGSSIKDLVGFVEELPQMGGCGELVSSKAQMEKSRACFSCGKLDHWYDRCPWIGSPCKRCNTGRFVKTSQRLHSWGQKFLSCPKCQSFQWMKDALKESMPEQKPSQLSSQVGGSSSVGSSNGKSKVCVQIEVDNLCEGFEAQVTVKRKGVV